MTHGRKLRKALLALAGCAVFVAPMAAYATTIQAVDLPALRDMSEVIVVAVVTGHRDGVREFTTEATLRVTESFKGPFRPGDEIPLTVERGRIGDMVREALGEASYPVGSRAVVFLESLEGEWVTLGLSYGKLDVFQNAKGKDMAVRCPEGQELGGYPDDVLSSPIALDDLRPMLVPERPDDIRKGQR